VSWLRPSRRLVDAEGTAWEIYVTRMRTGSWQALDTPDVDPLFEGHRGDVVWLLFPFLVLAQIAMGIARLIALVPRSVAGVALRRPLRIEAIAEFPGRRTRAWVVEKPDVERVLDEIASGLRAGSIPAPAGTRYLGELLE
jgi:hypothetical protein